MNNGIVLLLNGTSSSGKSTLAKALQEVLDEPFLHMDGDYFWQLYPKAFFAGEPDDIYLPWRNRFLPARPVSSFPTFTSTVSTIFRSTQKKMTPPPAPGKSKSNSTRGVVLRCFGGRWSDLCPHDILAGMMR